MLRRLFLYEEYYNDSTEPIFSVTSGVLLCHPDRGQAEVFIKTASHPISHHSITPRMVTGSLQDDNRNASGCCMNTFGIFRFYIDRFYVIVWLFEMKKGKNERVKSS